MLVRLLVDASVVDSRGGVMRGRVRVWIRIRYNCVSDAYVDRHDEYANKDRI